MTNLKHTATASMLEESDYAAQEIHEANRDKGFWEETDMMVDFIEQFATREGS